MNVKEWFIVARYMKNNKLYDNKRHLYLAGNWLLKAQEDNGGYAHSYHLFRGWLPAYPETTGYIIPTMIRLSKILNEIEFMRSAEKAGRWLLSIQRQDGSFCDLSGRKQIFDTAQILYGFLALYKESKEQRYLDAMIKSANWLIDNQEYNGSWIKFAYKNRPHTYYSRVGAILLNLGDFLKNERFFYAGKKNIEWVLSNQLNNGFFKYMSFLNEPPYLHTITYTLEGLLESYKILKDKEILSRILLATEKLIKISKSDFVLSSQYDDGWKVKNKEKCITGLAQWSNVALEIYKLTDNLEYLKEAEKTMSYLKTKQIVDGTVNLTGALMGSIPIWGRYMRFSFPNWAVKYFIDGLISLETINIP